MRYLKPLHALALAALIASACGSVGSNSGGAKPVNSSETIYVPGQAQDTGQNGQPSGSGQGNPNDLVPYNSVLAQYRDQALSQVDRADIPDQERQLVEQYFTDLGQ